MNTNAKLYYTAPRDDLFEEMKRECIAQWRTFDNSYGYVDEKVGRIKDIKNVEDNFMYMLAMFDQMGQTAVIARLSPAAKVAVRERLVAGGNYDYYITALGL